jgi:hypothetical protein
MKTKWTCHAENQMPATIKFFTDPLWTKYIKTMLRRQAYRFELRPSGQQLRNLRQFAGSCRFVYNKALALNTARYNKKENRLGYAGLCALLPGGQDVTVVRHYKN